MALEPAAPTKAEEANFLTEVSGYHHKKMQEGWWRVTGVILGCGLMQLYGLSQAEAPQAKVSLEKLKKRMMTEGGYKCGTVVAMLGSSFFTPTLMKAIADLGFKEVYSYRNEAHPHKDKTKQDTQKLFVLTWE